MSKVHSTLNFSLLLLTSTQPFIALCITTKTTQLKGLKKNKQWHVEVY